MYIIVKKESDQYVVYHQTIPNPKAAVDYVVSFMTNPNTHQPLRKPIQFDYTQRFLVLDETNHTYFILKDHGGATKTLPTYTNVSEEEKAKLATLQSHDEQAYVEMLLQIKSNNSMDWQTFLLDFAAPDLFANWKHVQWDFKSFVFLLQAAGK